MSYWLALSVVGLLLVGDGSPSTTTSRPPLRTTTTTSSTLTSTTATTLPSECHLCCDGVKDKCEKNKCCTERPIIIRQHVDTSERGGNRKQPQQIADNCECEAVRATARWTGWLVFVGAIVGGLQIRLLFGSLRVAQAAAGAARTSADAAKASADHVRRTERPWIIVQSHVDGPPTGWPEAGSWASVFPFPPRLTLPWTLSNHGKTPAWITRAGIHFEVREWPLPETPVQPKMTPWNDWLITTEKPHGHTMPLEVSEEHWPEHWRAILAQRECVIFYGLVEYRDVFGDTHMTRFCETWYVAVPNQHSPVNFMPMGPTKEWTEYT